MPLKCICLNEEYIGSDSAAVCRRAIAKAKGYQCPRSHDKWLIHESCFNLTQLFHKPRAVVLEMMHPTSAAICGTGDPTDVKA